MSELIIRQATEQDIDAIADIEETCFTTPWSHQAITEELTKNKMAFYIVAELEDQVVGYAGIWLIVDEGHITNVAVLPQYRHKQIATAILGVLIEFTEEEGIVRHTLEVRSSNQAARKLYSNFGFKEAGLRKGYYKDNGEDAVIMWRDPANPPRN